METVPSVSHREIWLFNGMMYERFGYVSSAREEARNNRYFKVNMNWKSAVHLFNDLTAGE